MSRSDPLNELRERDLLDLAEQVAKAHQCTVVEMVSDSRLAAFVAARQELWLRLRETGHWSLTRIAQLARRDTSTVIHGIRKAKARAA
jgi:chromosomal replication initiation ATPase DnaA